MERGIPEELAMLAKGLPPVAQWNPAQCGTIDIRIARDGTWYHDGTPIGRKELVRLFSTVLRKEADGFYLVTPAEKMKIVVEDAPFVAVLLKVEGAGRDQKLVFTTNVGDQTAAGPENVIRVEADPAMHEPAPYVHVRNGLEAKIARPVFYQLADIAEHGDDGTLGVWSAGTFFVLGPGA
jgi:hypothetical protein